MKEEMNGGTRSMHGREEKVLVKNSEWKKNIWIPWMQMGR